MRSLLTGYLASHVQRPYQDMKPCSTIAITQSNRPLLPSSVVCVGAEV